MMVPLQNSRSNRSHDGMHPVSCSSGHNHHHHHSSSSSSSKIQANSSISSSFSAKRTSRAAWDMRCTAERIKIDLIIEGRRLPKKNSFAQADAFACLWQVPAGYTGCSQQAQQKNGNRGSSSASSSTTAGGAVTRLPTRQEREIGRTEVVRNSKNPRFEATFTLDYKFEEEQAFVVRCYDEDLRYATDLKEHDFIGGCVFRLGEVMGAAGCTIARPLHRAKAFVVLTGQEIVENREALQLRLSGERLGVLQNANSKKKNTQTHHKGKHAAAVTKNTYYYQLERLNAEDQSWTVVWKSEVAQDNHNSPTWTMARLPLQQLCDDNPRDPLKITLWTWNRYQTDELLGAVEVSVQELVEKCRRGIPVFDVFAERKRFLVGGTKLKKAGMLKVLKSKVVSVPSMLQYTAGGCELNLIIAADCTTKNGATTWRDENCLHYQKNSSPSSWNDYQAVIHRLGSIFEAHESKSDFALWGYGGSIAGGDVPHFPMGPPAVQQQQKKPQRCKTANDLVKAYNNTFSSDSTLQLGEPKSVQLRSLVEAAVFQSLQSSENGDNDTIDAKQQQFYTVLVILSTGAMEDVVATSDAICAASEDAPLSICIIGMGDNLYNDFIILEHLAGMGATAAQGKNNNQKNSANRGSGRLVHSVTGLSCPRDMVNFSTLQDCEGDAAAVVAEALRAVPDHFVQYFTNSGTKPLPPKAVNDFTKEDVFGTTNNEKNEVVKTKKKRKSGVSSRRSPPTRQ